MEDASAARERCRSVRDGTRTEDGSRVDESTARARNARWSCTSWIRHTGPTNAAHDLRTEPGPWWGTNSSSAGGTDELDAVYTAPQFRMGVVRTAPIAAFSILLIATVVSRAGAQGGERLVGPDELGRPIIISAVDESVLGTFAKVAGVPMGVELAPSGAGSTGNPVTLTGLSVEKALQAIAGIDRRYELREMDGVFVLRTREAWDWPNHPLHLPVPAVVLNNIRSRNALALIAALLGAPQYRGVAVGDTKRFSLNLQPGTVIDLLNGTVRAHGGMAWSFKSSREPPAPQFPYVVGLQMGGSGGGCGVPGLMPEHPVDVALYGDAPVLSTGSSPAVLDRIVGNNSEGRPLRVIGPYPSAISYLAEATKAPMGIEFLGPDPPARSGNINATGRTLREVLDAMIAVDPRYEWREMQGVIVVRPAAAWHDPESILFRLVPSVRLANVSPQAAIDRVAQALGFQPVLAGFADGKTISLDQPQGTVLDLVNAMLRAHGEITWALTPSDPDAKRAGYRYYLFFHAMGGGGIGIPLR